LKIAFDIRGIEGDRSCRILFVITILLILLYPFSLDAFASSSMTLTLPELMTCKNSAPLKLSNIVKSKAAFDLKPIVTDCLGGGKIASYLVSLGLADETVTVPYVSNSLGQRTSPAKALGLSALPVSAKTGYYHFDMDFEDISEKLGSGDYCLLIWHESPDEKRFCINRYGSIKDDRPVSSAIGNQIVYSYKTASLGDHVSDAFSMVLSPFYVSAIESWYYGAEYYLRPKGLDISADFLQHSLLDEPEDLEFDEESEVAKKIRGNEKYKKAREKMEENVQAGYLTSDELKVAIPLIFTSGDLFTSIGKADFEYSAEKSDEGYAITVIITDNYNYEFKGRDYYKEKLFETSMNNMAVPNQYLGVIHNYGVKIELHEFIPFNQSDDEDKQ